MSNDPILPNDWSFGRLIIAIIVIAACIGILLVALNVFGVAIPSWAMTMFWIVVVASVAIVAVKFLLRL